MGAGAYIGRVGGLAVALGVGTAVATGQGVAVAQTDQSSSNSSNTEQSTGAPAATGTAAPTASTVTTQIETSTSGDAEKTEGAVTPTGAMAVTAQTNTGSSAAPALTGDVEAAKEVLPTGAAVPTGEAQPTGEAEPTETAGADPTTDPDPDPTKSSHSENVSSDTSDVAKSHNDTTPAVTSGLNALGSNSLRTVETLSDPSETIKQASRIAVFADARSLASVQSQTFSPTTAAFTPTQNVSTAPTAPADVFTAVANVVAGAVNLILNPFAGTNPAAPAEPPLIWGLLAFARRELDTFFSAWAGDPAEPAAATTLAQPQLRSLALAATPTQPLYSPFPNAQVSPSTQFVGWVTGPNVYPDDPLLANTLTRYSVYGTDVGVMWDNGIADNPATAINEHQILIAVGDTFGGPNLTGDWRPNTIFRSSDTNLADGIEIPNGQWYTGNMFGGAPLGPDGFPTRARQVIFPEGLPAGVTLIPTAGISVPDPTTPFKARQYVSFMSVSQWGSPGSWSTNYSAIAYSDDNGETFHVAPQTVRYNQPWTGNQNFQQSAFVRPGDGYVYTYGTPNGRQGAAYVARVAEKDILNLSQYEYYSKGSAGFFGWGATPAGWYKNNPSAATPIFGADQGACGVANPGNQVSELSVQYNKTLKKYVTLYGDQFNNIVMRTSDTPQGTWSDAKVLMPQQSGGIYAPMMHPWSPSTQGTGNDLYWNLSLSSQYNVMLMRTDLTKV